MDLATSCQRAIVTIDAQRPLRDAATLMLEHHVGTIVVTTASEGRPQVVGLLTDRDLAIAYIAHALDPAQVLAGAVASRPTVYIASSSSVAQAVEAMRAAGVRRLLVRDALGQVVGLLSSDDLLATLVEPLQVLARSYGAGIERERARGEGAAYATATGPVYLRDTANRESA
jgi:CBS domain-containing protein